MTSGSPQDDGLVFPIYGTDSIAAVLPAACGAMGIELTTAVGLNSLDCAQALGLPKADAVVVILCDGLGLENLRSRLAHAPFIRRALSGSASSGSMPGPRDGLLTTFPSTTAAAISVFGTGSAPGLTGLLGYTQRDPASHALLNMVQWTSEGKPSPLRPTELQREPTVFSQAAAAGVAVAAVGPKKFAGSGLTTAALNGASYLPVEKLAERVNRTAEWVRANRGNKSLAYLYWADLDKIGHKKGWRSAKWGDALADFDRELQHLLRLLPSGTLVLVTADHGQIEIDPAEAIDVALAPELARDVAAIGGEPRAVHVYLEPGADPTPVQARWRAYLGNRAVVLTRQEAISRGWFGPVSAQVKPWIGDLVVAALANTTIVDSRTQPDAARALIGVHGSLTETEMRVPLLVFVA